MTRGILATAMITTSSAALLGGLIVAPAAQAYPPGQQPTVSTNQSSYTPRERVRLRADNVEPGCRVAFQVTNQKTGKRFTVRAQTGTNNRAVVAINAAKNKAKFRVVMTDKCTGQTASTSFRVR